jgi:hypothetical protein
VLLVGSILLVAAGGVTRARGPAYAGALGFLVFVFLVGADLDDETPEGTVFGWPVILLLAAALAISASVLANRSSAPPAVNNPDHSP